MEASISATEASKMLEAALQQMDGIIATSATTNVSNSVGVGIGVDDGSEGGGGASTNMQTGSSCITTVGSGVHSLSEHNYISASNVLSTANTLALALQQVSLIAPPPDPVTAAIISNWLDTHVPRQDSDERLRRLQRDKENLAIQYQLLADKVDEQSSKIIELERLLAERTQQLSAKEELLHRQICTRSELETQKLELMNALSELKLHRAALEKENLNLKNLENLAQSTEQSTIASPITTTTLTVTAKPLQTYGSMGNLNVLIENSSTPKTAATATSLLKYQRPVAAYFHSLPRIQISKNHKSKLPWIHLNTSNNSNSSNNNHISLENNVSNKQRNVVFASHEKILIDDNDDDGVNNSSSAHSLPYQFTHQQHQQSQQQLHDVLHGLKTMGSPNLKERSTKSLRNILGKLKRSNSGHLESLPDSTDYNNDCSGEFRRGDRARSTAGGRIEYSRSITPQSAAGTAIKNWSDWSIQELCNWLCDLGFHCYEDDCRKWLTQTASIKTFFSATPEELEKELNIKWPLHRKKLILARDDLMGTEKDTLALQAGQLDVNWVLRWLDDIGLPQYKDTFVLNKVDGRVLHRLTMEDLLQLQLTSCLHIASLRRAIQCMREIHWQPECLIRRSMNVTSSSNPSTRSEMEEKSSDVSSSLEECSDTIPALIPLWTAHRVMEWLRVLDLSEYAPNLRGAGVHGALMIYEPRFNANLLADLLSIPPSKTLLRRHLATHFKELLGRDIIQNKRAAETERNYQPLSITAKLKAPKKSQFTLKRRKNSKHLWNNFNQNGDELDWHDYVCPMLNTSTPISTSSSNSLSINNSITNNNNNSSNNNNNNNNNNSNDNNSSNNTSSNVIKT